MRIVRFVLPAFFHLVVLSTQAQDLGASVYSRLGIGDVADPAFGRNRGMGGAGVALYHQLQTNTLNPAALGTLRRTCFEFGLTGKRTIARTADNNQYHLSGNIQHITLAFPIHKSVALQAGARPYSSVNYQDNDNLYQIGDKGYKVSFNGSGGLSDMFFGAGYSYKNKLMLGFNGGLVSGQTVNERAQLEESVRRFRNVTEKYEKHLRFTPGILYNYEFKSAPLPDTLMKIGDSIVTASKSVAGLVQENWFLGIGLTGSFYHTLEAQETQRYYQAKYGYAGGYIDYFTYDVDTLYDRKISNYSLPSSVKAGVSLYKPNYLSIALDYGITKWSNFTYNQFRTTYRDEHTVALGAELIPDARSTKLYKRIAYRAGINATSLPYKIEDTGIGQVQATVGAGYTYKPQKTPQGVLVTVNVALTYGQRGTTTSSLVKEEYWLASFNIVASDFWFIRRKHD